MWHKYLVFLICATRLRHCVKLVHFSEVFKIVRLHLWKYTSTAFILWRKCAPNLMVSGCVEILLLSSNVNILWKFFELSVNNLCMRRALIWSFWAIAIEYRAVVLLALFWFDALSCSFKFDWQGFAVSRIWLMRPRVQSNLINAVSRLVEALNTV